MANEIRTLLNGVQGVVNDWRQDWIDSTVRTDYLTDWSSDLFGGSAVAGSNTGNGTCSTVRYRIGATVAETWTLTATSATNFTVSGSTTGSTAALTVGTPYSNGKISLTITAGTTAFQSGDTFTITVAAQTAPANTVLPVISDTTPNTSQALTVGTGTWTGTATITYMYQWYRGTNTAIPGATTNAYTTTSDDAGYKLHARVRATNGVGTAYVDTVETLINVGAPQNTVAPAVTGTEEVGETLSCTTGTWSPVATSYAYQWYNTGVAISSATANTYVLQASDEGDVIHCKVTATNANGDSLATASNSTGAIAA